MSDPVNLASGERNATIDAGFVRPAALGDYVWADTNANGIQDPGEPGLADVEVTLEVTYPNGTVITVTTFTDADGGYIFAVPPGDYTVYVDTTTLPTGLDNQTGDPLFEGSLEHALQVGLEGAAFVSSYERAAAKKLAEKLQSTDKLNAEVAQLIAAREGVKLVLAGSIVPDGNKLDLAVNAVVPTSG